MTYRITVSVDHADPDYPYAVCATLYDGDRRLHQGAAGTKADAVFLLYGEAIMSEALLRTWPSEIRGGNSPMDPDCLPLLSQAIFDEVQAKSAAEADRYEAVAREIRAIAARIKVGDLVIEQVPYKPTEF